MTRGSGDGERVIRVRKVFSQLRTVDAPRSAQWPRCAAASPRGAIRAPLKLSEKFLTSEMDQ